MNNPSVKSLWPVFALLALIVLVFGSLKMYQEAVDEQDIQASTLTFQAEARKEAIDIGRCLKRKAHKNKKGILTVELTDCLPTK